MANIGLALSSTTLDTTVQGPESAACHCGWYGPHCLPTLACQTHHELGAGTRISPTCTMLCVVTSDWFVLQILTWTQFKTSTNCICDLGECGWAVVRVVQFVSRHSCVADRLPVVVRFPAGPRVRLKTVDPPKGKGLGQKKRRVWVGIIDPSSPNRLLESDTHAALCKLGSSSLHRPPFHCQCHHPHPLKCQPLQMPWRPKT